MNNKISIVILGKNSGVSIKRLSGILNRFSEIIIIDDYSTDNTVTLCKDLGFRYLKRHLNKNFAEQRNYALQKASNDWVLFLDSDEEINGDLVNEIYNKINENKYDGFYIKRKVVFLDHVMSGTEMGNDKIIRVGNKRKGRWFRKVHEIWRINGKLGTLDIPIIHHTASNLYLFINKLSNYYEIHSFENEYYGKRPLMLKIILYPTFKFIRNFILLHGHRDRVYGFVVSVLMSLHTFLSWSDYWLRSRKQLPGVSSFDK